MDYVITHHDPSGNGILKGGALTTLDAGSPAMNSWLGSMYLAAVNASAHLAKAAGDTAAADKYDAIYNQGKTNQENMLWNGQYYVEKHKVEEEPPTLSAMARKSICSWASGGPRNWGLATFTIRNI